jgi:thymidylate synthase ThyX
MIQTRIIADSISESGARLTTFEVKTARYILAELNTHRALSRNASSSRAEPVKSMIERVVKDPYLPDWSKNCKGMSPTETLSEEDAEKANQIIIDLMNQTAEAVEKLSELGVHKQHANRYLEPWAHVVWLVSLTNDAHSNFFALRTDIAAQAEIRLPALQMQSLLKENEPKVLKMGKWHLPFITDEDLQEIGEEQAKLVSAARCARVSYLNHDGTRDISKDIDLANRLLSSGHMSPFEHQGTPLLHKTDRSGNFSGFLQLRKTIVGECR